MPVGGNYTVDADEAVRYANGIGARVTVAMHFKTKIIPADIIKAAAIGFIPFKKALQ